MVLFCEELLSSSVSLLSCCFILCVVSCYGDAPCGDIRVGKSFNVETLIITNCEHGGLSQVVFGNLLTVGSLLSNL